MTWRDAEELLRSSRTDLPHVRELLRTWARPADVFELIDGLTRDTLDAAIHEFATTGKWRELNKDEKAALVFRREFAADLLLALDSTEMIGPPNPNLASSAGAVLEWALVEVWSLPGFQSTAAWLRHIQDAAHYTKPEPPTDLDDDN